jgi:hypothetical protein
MSSVGNHISLHSFGLPFAQLQAIECAARIAIKAGMGPQRTRAAVESLTRYAHAQGLTRRQVAIKEPLAGSALAS